MTSSADLCLRLGAIISIGIFLLKRLPFGAGKWIGKNPKAIAAFLATVSALAPMIHGAGVTIAQVAVCIAAQLTVAAGTHEVALKPVERRLFST